MKRGLVLSTAIGLWALNQPRWQCNDSAPVGQREDWQGRGKKRKPQIR